MWAAFSLAVLYLAVLAAGVYEDGMNLFQFRTPLNSCWAV